MNDIMLVLFALVTSTLTAITGIGGGMILIALMPGLLPASAIVPVHGVVQLFANFGRAFFGWRFLQWKYVTAFVAGAVTGGSISAWATRGINLEYTPVIIGLYILYSVWAPRLEIKRLLPGEFVFIGMIQTGLSMIVGATGPMGQASLMRRGLDRDALVVTSALMTFFTHAVKIVLFGLLGFSFATYWKIIAGMSAGVLLGAYIGTHIRYRIPQAIFNKALTWILTFLALRMIYITLA